MQYTSLDDDKLCQLLSDDDKNAFQEIYKRYWKKLYIVAERKTHRQNAEEIIQDLFANLWQNRKNRINNLKFYLFSSVKYGILNQIKKEINEQKFAEYALYSLQNSDNSTDYTLLLNDLSESLESGLAKLPAKTQQIFKMSRFELLSIKAIALKCDLSEKAIEYHISQALKTLKDHLKNYHLLAFFTFIELYF